MKINELVEMSIKDVLTSFKSQRAAAKALRIPYSTLWDMLKRGDTVTVLLDGNTGKPISIIGKSALRPMNTEEVNRFNKEYGQNESEVLRQIIAGCYKAPKVPKRQGLIPDTRFDISDKAEEKYKADTNKKIDDLTIRCQNLSSELNHAKKDRLSTDEVRKHIFSLSTAPLTPAKWLTPKITPTSDYIGVPTLMLSDIHHGETVFPTQVFSKNEYNMEISRSRIQEVGRRTIDVLTNHMVAPKGYPGIILNLAGDLVSGDIHDELIATNDAPTIPAVIDLINELIPFISNLADAFNRVMVFSVPGNHGRTTRKVQHKQTSYTNYDWLIACMLERHFLDDDRINFHISDQQDLQYKVYDHRYRLTHGSQFRGGQGFVGAFAPISKGDKKKRSASASYGMEYDTLVMGHFHQLWMPGRIIVNGSIVGFNEFAINNNFDFEVPKQALWITNPEYGITYTMPIFCEKPISVRAAQERDKDIWVQWHED